MGHHVWQCGVTLQAMTRREWSGVARELEGLREELENRPTARDVRAWLEAKADAEVGVKGSTLLCFGVSYDGVSRDQATEQAKAKVSVTLTGSIEMFFFAGCSGARRSGGQGARPQGADGRTLASPPAMTIGDGCNRI